MTRRSKVPVAILIAGWLAVPAIPGRAGAQAPVDKLPEPTVEVEGQDAPPEKPAAVPAAPPPSVQAPSPSPPSVQVSTPPSAPQRIDRESAMDVVRALPRMAAATPREPVRSNLNVAAAFTSSFLILPSATPLPLPEAGFVVGVNLGPYLMIDAGAGLAFLAAGAKLFLTTGDVAPYLVGRVGATPWTGKFVQGGIGLDVSRPDGTYAYMEGGPLLASSDISDQDSTSPPGHWRTIDVEATFGYGKRF